MPDDGVEPALLHAWLAGRSIARGVPAPVSDHGGYRVDTNTDAELKRWVFPQMVDGLVALANSITEPRLLLKLCGTPEALQSVLPDGWRLQAPAYFMQATGARLKPQLPPGYSVEIHTDGRLTEVRITADSGELAANGYAAETPKAFVYDRIATTAGHRRKGLGRVVMAMLQQARRTDEARELLVATEAGRALYTELGWRVISPYVTASFDEV